MSQVREHYDYIMFCVRSGHISWCFDQLEIVGLQGLPDPLSNQSVAMEPYIHLEFVYLGLYVWQTVLDGERIRRTARLFCSSGR